MHLEFFGAAADAPRLTRLREKLLALSRYSVDRVLCVPFNQALAAFGVAPRRGWPAINFFFNTMLEDTNAIGMDDPWSRPGDYVLLGMSFLQYYDLRQEGDRLILQSR